MPIGTKEVLRIPSTDFDPPPLLPGTYDTNNDTIVSVGRAPGTTRLRLKEPTPFKGDSIKKCRAFLRELALTFALSGATYTTSISKVLYSVIYLSSKASER